MKRFAKKNRFCNGDMNKFCLMLKKIVYPYEYNDNCQSFDGTLLPKKKEFYSSLNIEDMTDANYKHVKYKETAS